MTRKVSEILGINVNVATLDGNGRLVQNINASKITGVIPIENIPQAAIEKLVIVPNQAARFALTVAQIQEGDTVKENDTGLMFFVVDENNLNNSTGYESYTAGQASSVPWAGITNVPSNLLQIGGVDTAQPDDFYLRYNATLGVWESVTALEIKANLGLDNVDNTADMDKPVSTAQWYALETRERLRQVIEVDTDIVLDDSYHNCTIVVTAAVTIKVPEQITLTDGEGVFGCDFKIKAEGVRIEPQWGNVQIECNGEVGAFTFDVYSWTALTFFSYDTNSDIHNYLLVSGNLAEPPDS